MNHDKNAKELRDSIQIAFDYSGERPACDHGPMLLFERQSMIGRRFFACSAYRDRKLCPAYILESVWEKERTKGKTTAIQSTTQLLLRSNELNQIRENIVMSHDQKMKDKSFCHSCGEIFVTMGQHANHKITAIVSNNLLDEPSKILDPLDHSKKEAQYFFSEDSIKVILGLLQDAKVSHILCISCPTIFEKLKKDSSKKCLMLDLDVRYRQFYNPEEYLLYNMFNHHFFDKSESVSVYEQFLTEGKNNLALVMDPPFGGKVEVISHTLQTIDDEYRHLNGENATEISKFWIFPYFMESQIVSHLPSFAMLDYKVEYKNHSQFQKGPQGRKQGSPVRIFTNVSLQKLKLPAREGYKYCNICKKWISPENRHCMICNSCTSKDGRTYVHCDQCKRCVKPTWFHCLKCKRCALPEHPCVLFQERSKETAIAKKRKACTLTPATAKSTSDNWIVTECRNT
ncbi:hypothetical protein GHT06_014864 [Daphnia sinensis]|uniref:CTCHY-type domain-containing protein n=1 Tax=Daphnia sinensis TaxID=1820382 RepID=A0AAD5KQG7_9CRUS|nr:hypothetical protein GHT06_014864 [Daphnia sinensis]